MPSAEDALYQFLRQCGRSVLVFRQRLHVGQFIADAFHEVKPVDPGLSADIGRNEILPVAASRRSRHTGKARRIPILLVDRNTLLLKEVIEEIDTLSIILVVLGVYSDNGVKAFPTAVNKRRDRQL